MKVTRINSDNFPVCKKGDVGVVCEDTPKTIQSFGTTNSLLEHGMILVDFGTGPSPNQIKHLQF